MLKTVKCRLCGKYFKLITNTHLAKHKIKVSDYIKRFGSKGVGFLSPNLLPKDDPRYKKWKITLRKRSEPWNKGKTKHTHPSVAKISETMRRKKIDNFAKWRQQMIGLGIIRNTYPPLAKNAGLAELIGVILGDGHIHKFPRTESLEILSNSNNLGFIKRYKNLVEIIFNNGATVNKRKDSNCTRIRIYQKNISKRLGIPAGNRNNLEIKIPKWIFQNKKFLLSCLRGLYEAEGSFCIHRPTYTNKLIFYNSNKSLLNFVYRSLHKIGFHPHKTKRAIQLSRKKEVQQCKNLISFRNYPNAG